MVDFIGKAELAEDGTVKGLDDEVKKLVEGKDTAFLFEKSTGTKFKGAKSAEKGDPNGGNDAMTLEKLKAMNPWIATTIPSIILTNTKNFMEVMSNGKYYLR